MGKYQRLLGYLLYCSQPSSFQRTNFTCHWGHLSQDRIVSKQHCKLQYLDTMVCQRTYQTAYESTPSPNTMCNCSSRLALEPAEVCAVLGLIITRYGLHENLWQILPKLQCTLKRTCHFMETVIVFTKQPLIFHQSKTKPQALYLVVDFLFLLPYTSICFCTFFWSLVWCFGVLITTFILTVT